MGSQSDVSHVAVVVDLGHRKRVTLAVDRRDARESGSALLEHLGRARDVRAQVPLTANRPSDGCLDARDVQSDERCGVRVADPPGGVRLSDADWVEASVEIGCTGERESRLAREVLGASNARMKVMLSEYRPFDRSCDRRRVQRGRARTARTERDSCGERRHRAEPSGLLGVTPWRMVGQCWPGHAMGFDRFGMNPRDDARAATRIATGHS